MYTNFKISQASNDLTHALIILQNEERYHNKKLIQYANYILIIKNGDL